MSTLQVAGFRSCLNSTLRTRLSHNPGWTSPSKSRESISIMASQQLENGSAVTIVGGGRIGSALAEMSPYQTTLVRRGESIPADPSGPIIVCTRNDDLDQVVKATPEARRQDLVFIQNGMLLPWLQERGLEDNTQALIYFGVPKLGAPPMDGVTELDRDGLTTVYGKHGVTLSEIIRAGGLACKVADKEQFLVAMLEKLIWISAVMLVGTKQGANVGEVESQHTKEVGDLMNELARAGEEALGVKVSTNMVDRLNAYSRAVASYPCAIKEFEWRNGWFYSLSQKALSEGKEDPCPMHTGLLKEINAV